MNHVLIMLSPLRWHYHCIELQNLRGTGRQKEKLQPVLAAPTLSGIRLT